MMPNRYLCFFFTICLLSIAGCKPVTSAVKLSELLEAAQPIAKVQLNQEILINANQQMSFKVELGRLDKAHAKFTYFKNQQQRTLSFTQAGSYSLVITSQTNSSATNIEKRDLTIEVSE